MKLILRADVENLGRLGDTVTVKPGYGRNYLLPQSLAMQLTPGNLKNFEREYKKLQDKMDSIRAEAEKLAKTIAETNLVISMHVGDNDKLYGSVTNIMICNALGEQNIIVDRRRILLEEPIRALGTYKVRIRLHVDVTTELTLQVVSEEKVYYDDDQKSSSETAEAENI